MINFKLKSEAIHFGSLMLGVCCSMISAVGWVNGHFASTTQVGDLSKRIDTEVEERRELKAEIDSIYFKLIPQTDRIQIKHPGKEIEK